MGYLSFHRDALPSHSQFSQEGLYQAYFWNPLPLQVDQFITSQPGVVRSWKADCPIPKSDLAYAQITHWNLQKTIQFGELMVHARVVTDVDTVFKQLFQAQYPIEKMKLIDCYDADDDRSMEDNNTSAFCSRAVTDRPGIFSVHSYGMAVDINPRQNPYVRQAHDGSLKVYPSNTFPECLRSPQIQSGDACQRAFESVGWEWGGTWNNPVDYQHFEKTTVRNPVV